MMMEARHVCYHLLLLLSTIFLVSGAPNYQYSVQLSSDYTFSWNITSDTIYAQVQVKAIAWVGFGLSPYSSLGIHGMPYADFIIATFNTSGVFVNDYYRNSVLPGQPSLDTDLGGQNNILSFSGSQNNGVTTVQWSRLLVTSDTQYDSTFSKGSVHIIYAWGTSNTFGYHGLFDKGFTTIDFYNGFVQSKHL